MAVVIIVLGLLYFFAHYLTYFFQKTRIPDVLILILVGIIMGPVLKLATPESFGAAGGVMTSIALIIILFEGGLNLELSSIMNSLKKASILSILFFIISTILVGIVMYLVFDFPVMVSLITGFILAGTSSAVVIPLVNALQMGKKPGTILVLESALTDVLCIVFALSFLNGYNSGAVEPGRIIGGLLSSLILASVIGIASGYFWLRVLDWVRKFPNTQFTTFAFMFIVYGVAEYFKFSGAIAALAFGIILGNYDKINIPSLKINKNMNTGIITDSEKSLYSEIVFLLKLFFFIYLGLSIPFQSFHIFKVAWLIVGLLYVARLITTRFTIREDFTWTDKSLLSALIPKGLAAAVLAGLPLQYGLIEGETIKAITFNVVLFSIITTSVLIPLIKGTPLGKLYKLIFSSNRNEIQTTELKND